MAGARAGFTGRTGLAWLTLMSCAGTAAADPHSILSTQLPDIVAKHQVAPVAVPDPGTVMVLSVSLPQRNQAALDALLGALYDPASPRYRQYLSVAEFTAQFGPTEPDYTTAVQFFTSAGLTILSTAANRGLLTVQGRVADIERVFHVTIGLYPHPSEARLFLSADREPTLDLAVPIQHITGLDNYVRPFTKLIRPQARGGPRASSESGPGSGPGGNLTGFDARAAYVGPGKPIGTGQSVGLMELAGYELDDVQRYFSWLNQPLNVPVVGISTDGASLKCRNRCDDSEQALDIEYAISMAPGLAQVQVYVGYNAEDVLNRQASDNSSAQLSTSWGWSAKEYPTDDPIFREMAAQGQTLLTASGDYSSLRASGPWPEEDVTITAVGGTNLVPLKPGGAWGRERGWRYSAGGPALGKTFPIANYQLPFINAANGGSLKWRNVPDVAADAALDNFLCADGGCFGGYGGTSFASPIWAGFIALANEKAAAHHRPRVGFLNPVLYEIGSGTSYRTLMHDQVHGTSGLYHCTTSYDDVTGLGSPTRALIDVLAGVEP